MINRHLEKTEILYAKSIIGKNNKFYTKYCVI